MGTLWAIFWSFLKVGTLAYGGGPSMIPLMEQEIVQERKWMEIKEFADILALGNGLPGPIATKMALAVGYKMDGYSGAATALFALLLPSSILMMLFVLFFFSFKDSPRLKSTLNGVRPAVMALLFIVAFQVGKSSVYSIPTLLIGIATFFIFLFTNLHPALGLLAAGLIGLFFL